MSEVKPTIAALRAWLKTCPLIADEQEATGAAFRIAGLEEESTAFSIEDSPGDPIITEYISGWEMAKNYLFLSRREYSEVDAVSIQNSGFFEQLTEWVMRQDARPQPARPLGLRRGQDPYRHCRDEQRLHRHKQRGQL